MSAQTQKTAKIVTHDKAREIMTEWENRTDDEPYPVFRVQSEAFVVNAKNEEAAKRAVTSKIRNAEITLVDNDP